MSNNYEQQIKTGWKLAPWGHFLNYQIKIDKPHTSDKINNCISALLKLPAFQELLNKPVLNNLSGLSSIKSNNGTNQENLLLQIKGTMTLLDLDDEVKNTNELEAESRKFVFEIYTELKEISAQQQLIFMLKTNSSAELPYFANLSNLSNIPNISFSSLSFGGEVYAPSILTAFFKTPPIHLETFHFEIHQDAIALTIQSQAWRSKPIKPLQKDDLIKIFLNFFSENLRINLQKELFSASTA